MEGAKKIAVVILMTIAGNRRRAAGSPLQETAVLCICGYVGQWRAWRLWRTVMATETILRAEEVSSWAD